MRLFNCVSEGKKALREIELQLLDNEELLSLAKRLDQQYSDGILQDGTVFTQAVLQISEELDRRLKALNEPVGSDL